MNANQKDWSQRLNDALWAYQIAYKTTLDMSPFRILFRKAYHLPVELEHKSFWAIKAINYNWKDVKEKRLLQLSELEELQSDAYENSVISKAKMKRWHDKKILRRKFKPGEKVLLYNFRLNLFPRKLKSRWSGPFEIVEVFPYGAGELKNPKE